MPKADGLRSCGSRTMWTLLVARAGTRWLSVQAMCTEGCDLVGLRHVCIERWARRPWNVSQGCVDSPSTGHFMGPARGLCTDWGRVSHGLPCCHPGRLGKAATEELAMNMKSGAMWIPAEVQ